jgi:hypothetical protein
MPDTEDVVRAIAQLRCEHPNGRLSSVCNIIAWGSLRRQGEGYFAYMDRMHGPMEPLP